MRSSKFRRAVVGLLGAGVLAAAAPAAVAAPTVSPMLRASAYAANGTYLNSGQSLKPGQSLISGETALAMQGDGNLVLYMVGPNGHYGPALWQSGTYGNAGAYALMQPDGNLVVYRQGRTDMAGALWATGTWHSAGAYLELLNGTVYINSSSAGLAWESNTRANPGDSIYQMAGLPSGTAIGSRSVWLIMQSDGNLVLYRKSDGAALWSSGTWNHPGAVVTIADGHLMVFNNGELWSVGSWNNRGAYLKVQDDANVVIYREGRSDPAGALWSTGTWGQG